MGGVKAIGVRVRSIELNLKLKGLGRSNHKWRARKHVKLKLRVASLGSSVRCLFVLEIARADSI